MSGDMRMATQENFWWMLTCWVIARKQSFSGVNGDWDTLFCLWNRMMHYWKIRTEPCDDCLGSQDDDVLGSWVFLIWLSSSQQDNKRIIVPESIPSSSHSHGLLIGDRVKKQSNQWKGRWEERWELSHPFQNSSHILGFQWKDWVITVICQVFCLDPLLHLSFPEAV